MIIDIRDVNKTLTEALKEAKSGDTICLADRTYEEKVVVEVPNITLVGTTKTKITYSDHNGKIVLGKNLGTTLSATFRVLPSANGFKALNVTFENSFDRRGVKNGQAVAFKSECSNLRLENCQFIGHQDTLYIDYGKNNLVHNCHICGDVDFIFGSADCLFTDCTVEALGDIAQNAYYVAPDTFKSNHQGFVFKNCYFKSTALNTYLGRPWFPSKSLESVYPRVSFIDCIFPKSCQLFLKQMHEEDSTSYVLHIENCRLV